MGAGRAAHHRRGERAARGAVLVSPTNTAHEILQSTITPAVLISATGTAILSTSNRTTRATDRLRELSAGAAGSLGPADS